MTGLFACGRAFGRRGFVAAIDGEAGDEERGRRGGRGGGGRDGGIVLLQWGDGLGRCGGWRLIRRGLDLCGDVLGKRGFRGTGEEAVERWRRNLRADLDEDDALVG